MLLLDFSTTETTIISVVMMFIFFCLGGIMGSAMNCFCYRYVKGLPWTGDNRSCCPTCGHTLGVFDLIPIFSYIFLGGKCRYCKNKISPRYVITELIMAVAFLVLLLTSEATLDGFVYYLTELVFVICLFCLSMIDIDTFEIPNRFIIIPAVIRTLFVCFFGINNGPWHFCGVYETLSTEGFSASAMLVSWKAVAHTLGSGFVVGGLLLLLSLIMDKLLKKESLGGGDIKLLAVTAMYFSFPAAVIVLLMACIIGLIMALIMRKAAVNVENTDIDETVTNTATQVANENNTETKTESLAQSLNENNTNCSTDNTEAPEQNIEEDDIPEGAFPFGPSISIAIFIGLICAEKLAELYMSMF